MIEPLDEEKYDAYINRILEERKNKKNNEIYMERHHIIPKSRGGSDVEDNLIWLYAQEHYWAHKLLALENPSDKKLQYAWWNMAHCKGKGNEREITISAEEYAQARASYVLSVSGENNTGFEKTGKHANWYGKTHSLEARQKISEARKRSKKNTTETKPKKIFSSEQRKRMSENHADVSGKKNPRARKVRCIETGRIFDTAKEAGEYYSLTPSNPGTTIRRACKTHRASGYDEILEKPLHWEYV